PVDRGPTSIPIDGDANGLWWDAAANKLYIADDDNNRILEWSDGSGPTKLAELPKAPQDGPGLCQHVKTEDGTSCGTRFGYDAAGDIVWVASDMTTGKVPNLDPAKQRIGLTVTSDGTLYDSYFVKTVSGRIGAVAKVDPAGTETDFVGALQKPVGVLA